MTDTTNVTSSTPVDADPEAETGFAIQGPSLGRRFVRSRLMGWLVVIALIALWEIARSSHWYSSPVLPGPATIVSAWWKTAHDGTLWPAVGQTLTVLGEGYGLAAVGGIAIGVLMARVRLAYVILEPLVELLRPIPIVAVVPLLVLLLGIGTELKVFAVLVAAIVPILLNTVAGVGSAPLTMRETASTFGLGGWRATWEVYLPSALPSIFVGLRTALSLSIVIAVLTEMISGNTGIGYLIITAQQSLDVNTIYALVLTLAVIGYLANLLFIAVAQLVLHWSPEFRARRSR